MRRAYEKDLTFEQLNNRLAGSSMIKGVKGINTKGSKKLYYVNPETLAMYIVKTNSKNTDNYDILEIEYNWSPTCLNNSGYRIVTLDGKSTTFHSIIANTFIDRPKYNRKENNQIDHINGNKLDNRPSNLRWTTRSGNMYNYYRVRREANKPITRTNHGKYYISKQIFVSPEGEQVPMTYQQYMEYRRNNCLDTKKVAKRIKINLSALNIDTTITGPSKGYLDFINSLAAADVATA